MPGRMAILWLACRTAHIKLYASGVKTTILSFKLLPSTCTNTLIMRILQAKLKLTHHSSFQIMHHNTAQPNVKILVGFLQKVIRIENAGKV